LRATCIEKNAKVIKAGLTTATASAERARLRKTLVELREKDESLREQKARYVQTVKKSYIITFTKRSTTCINMMFSTK
jgi:hypothetical protein